MPDFAQNFRHGLRLSPGFFVIAALLIGVDLDHFIVTGDLKFWKV
jgi:hypothetical protein